MLLSEVKVFDKVTLERDVPPPVALPRKCSQVEGDRRIARAKLSHASVPGAMADGEAKPPGVR